MKQVDALIELFLQFLNIKESKSQLKQDIFVLIESGMKRNGFFVEFGATNGVDLSNTYLLEKKFGWKGILAEPAKIWHEDLKKNRVATIETDCIWGVTGEIVNFKMTKSSEFSTISEFSSSDMHAETRRGGETYNVKTISLRDLLSKYDAPKFIDYLSIDTEGSEFEILRNFDFSEYMFGVITVEHNFTPMREKIHSLLSAEGYVRKFEHLSKWDDWYVRAN